MYLQINNNINRENSIASGYKGCRTYISFRTLDDRERFGYFRVYKFQEIRPSVLASVRSARYVRHSFNTGRLMESTKTFSVDVLFRHQKCMCEVAMSDLNRIIITSRISRAVRRDGIEPLSHGHCNVYALFCFD